jgi:hypothetical protein
MKLVSTIALGVALACGGMVMSAAPALAKKDEQKPASFNLSKPVREAAAAAQAALAKSDTAGALTAITPALSAATTPDDKFVANSILYDIARQTKDLKNQGAAIDGMISSGKVTGPQLAQMYLARGEIAYNAQDWKAAEINLDGAVKAGSTEPELYALQVETKAKLGKPAEALAMLQQASDKAKTSGQKLPADYYSRGISIGYNAKLAGPLVPLTQDWVTAYPTADNWRDALTIYRDLNHVDPEYELDIYRLLRTLNALKGEADYYTYAEQLYLKYPGEGKAVIDEGVAKGFLKPAPGNNTQNMLDVTKKRVAADKADLPSSAAAAAKSADGKSAFATANAYLGYGDYAKAAELYKLAIQKGNVDANVANTRLGMALARSGDKAGAKQVFASVTGPRAALAKFWTIWIDQQP